MISEAELPFTVSGRYIVTGELGRGGNAVVYRARDNAEHRDVAIKILREDVVSPHALARFHQEMKVSAALDHPNIMRVYDTGDHDGRPYIVLELVNGRSLAHRLEQESQFPVEEAIAIARDVGNALAFAHRAGVIHRDIKPENILLAERGAVLADFGIARVTQDGLPERLTSTGITVGTLLYMSPEQLMGERKLDGRTDQYSLACVLYEMLAGVRPHIAATMEGLRTLRTMERHLPVRAHRPSVGEGVDAALRKALSSMSADRYATMEEFVAALTAPSSAPDLQARRWIWWGAGVTAVAGLIVAVSMSNGDPTVPGIESPLTFSIESVRSADVASARLSGILATEIASWPDVRLGGRTRGGTTLTPVASRLGDSVRITIDVTGPRRRARVVRVVAVADFDSAAAFGQPLVRDLVAETVAAPPPGLDGLYNRSAASVRLYIAAFDAMLEGRLDSAASLFRLSAERGVRFANANLWSAQVGSWISPRNSAVWRERVEDAVRTGPLSPSDSLNAAALVALAQLDLPGMCGLYTRSIGVNPTSFVARFGLGECARLDTVVVRDGDHWRFRSSHWSAMQAYAQAVEYAPSSSLLAVLFPRVMQTTYAMGSRARHGAADDAAHSRFSAIPSLDHDTVALLPIPRSEFAGMTERSIPSTWGPALRRGREVARGITERWIAKWPGSAEGWLYRSLALELIGELGRADTAANTAEGALNRAAQGATTPDQRIRIAVARTRIALRRGDFPSAVSISDSALSARDTGTTSAVLLAPLAALVGDASRAERFARVAGTGDPGIPRDLADSVQAFRLRATLGACTGLSTQRLRLEELFRLRFTPAEVASARKQLLQDGYREAVPCIGPELAREFAAVNPLDSAYVMLASADQSAARTTLAGLRNRRAGATIGALTWDLVYVESWALVQSGDFIAARDRIVDALDDLASMSIYTLDQVPQAAGLRRAVALLDSTGSGRHRADEVKKWIDEGRVLTRFRPGGQR